MPALLLERLHLNARLLLLLHQVCESVLLRYQLHLLVVLVCMNESTRLPSVLESWYACRTFSHVLRPLEGCLPWSSLDTCLHPPLLRAKQISETVGSLQLAINRLFLLRWVDLKQCLLLLYYRWSKLWHVLKARQGRVQILETTLSRDRVRVSLIEPYAKRVVSSC